MVDDFSVENNSEQGANVQVQDVIAKRFNWGACLLSWIWGIYHRAWWTLLIIVGAFVPFIGLFVCMGLCIWFGVKGNEWAWQNRKYESIEAFHASQKKWAIAGAIVFIIGLILQLVFGAAIIAILTAGNVQ